MTGWKQLHVSLAKLEKVDEGARGLVRGRSGDPCSGWMNRLMDGKFNERLSVQGSAFYGFIHKTGPRRVNIQDLSVTDIDSGLIILPRTTFA